MATLRAPPGELMEFTRLKEILKATDLGAHIMTLEGAGYLKVDKDFVGKKPRTRVSLTRTGRAAFERHVAYLKEILDAGE